MVKKIVAWMVISSILLSGCGILNKVANPSGTEAINAYPIQSANEETTNNSGAYPNAEATQNDAYNTYPGPESDSSAIELYPEYFVNQLAIPKARVGKAVVTGQLLNDGDATKPLITVLYLSAVTLNSDPNQAPVINFKMDTDPIATQEISSGRFVFSDVSPGQYALVIWSASGISVVESSPGNKLVFEALPDQVTDLGVLSVSH